MKNRTSSDHQRPRRLPIVAVIAAVTAAFTLGRPLPAHAERVTPPLVPTAIQVTGPNRAFFEGHAAGTQNYVCLPSGSGVAWTLFGPQATLFSYDLKQVITHFLSGNPSENGLPRATWLHSRDSSAVWAVMINQSSDSRFVAPGAIPWLKLQVFGAQDGPTGGHTLTPATFIQRVNTAGGVSPSTGCAASTDVGKKALVPYTADYFFYKASSSDGDDDND